MPAALSALIVYCHPVEDSFAAALRDRVAGAFRRAGANCTVLDLYAEGFDPVLGRDERLAHLDHDLRPADLAAHFAALERADLLVFVYPTWWYGPPAMLKGWIDRTMRAGVAFRLPPGADVIEPMLTRVRRIVVVTTYGSPWWLIRYVGDAGRRIIARGLQLICPNAGRPVWLALYGMDTASALQRSRFLERVEDRVTAAVRQARRSGRRHRTSRQ
ncbi:MAG: NAD(P)H-dependent oxidoreductase [Alphaproteobacteria bacterium]